MHEFLIDLHAVNPKTPQVAQRGVPGAEIVERQLHSHLIQAIERRDRALRILHRGAFGDLELQVARRKS